MLILSAAQLIGGTPLLQLQGGIYAKLEMFNPAGSSKDRVALALLRDGEDRGLLRPGATIIEATSGNTGLGLAALAAQRGYGCIILMPEAASAERKKILRALGAQVIQLPTMAQCVEKAEQLHQSSPGSYLPGQFLSPANPMAHYRTTGPEIWRDLQGRVDIFLAGIGTGGTITGVGRFLREQKPDIQIIGVEPAEYPHGIQGIGAGFQPKILDTSLPDERIFVTTAAAVQTAQEFGRENGLLIGISSGAALWAARDLAQRPENQGKSIVTLFPDSGERYLSVLG